MKIFLSLRVTADAGGGLKNRAHLRPVLQGVGGGQPPTSTRRVYTGALLAATQIVEKSPHTFQVFFALYSSPHAHIASKIGFKLYPSSVNVYSTRGGTSG